MIKQVLVSSALMFSMMANAHTQAPSSFGGSKNITDAISIEDTKTVDFTIGNLYDAPMNFEVTVDGTVVGETGDIASGQTRVFPVELKTTEYKKAVTYKVCSRTIVKSGVRTQLCSKAQVVRL